MKENPNFVDVVGFKKIGLVSEVSNKLNENPISMDVGFLRQRGSCFLVDATGGQSRGNFAQLRGHQPEECLPESEEPFDWDPNRLNQQVLRGSRGFSIGALAFEIGYIVRVRDGHYLVTCSLELVNIESILWVGALP